jgi:hypothetical protein
MKATQAAVILLILLIIGGILSAQKPKQREVLDIDLIIEKSNKTMQKASAVSKNEGHHHNFRGGEGRPR